MTKNQMLWRWAIVLGSVAAAALLVAPTAIYFGLDKAQMGEVRKRAEAFNQFVPDYLPKKHVNLGLDLAGGIHLVLAVDLDKALENKVDRLALSIGDYLEREKLDGVDVVVTDRPGGRIEMTGNEDSLLAYVEKGMSREEFELVSADSGQRTLLVSNEYIEALRKDAISQAMRSIRNRVDSLGVAEPQISARGEDSIVVQLPGYDNPEEARRLLGRTAQLEFRMALDEDRTVAKLAKSDLPEGVIRCTSDYSKPTGGNGTDSFLVGTDRDQLVSFLDSKLSGDKAAAIKLIEPGERGGIASVCEQDLPGEKGEKAYRTFTLTRTVPLSGDHVVDAFVSTDPRTNRPDVTLVFSESGKQLFGNLTKKHTGERFAIVLEGMVDSAPVINEPILGGRCQISLGGGGGRQKQYREAEGLTTVLKAGALPAPVTIAQDRTVGASLGEDSIAAGTAAIGIGGVLVIFFMLFYYGFAGVVANVALVLNLVFIMAILSMFGATLTLPGIAGMVLTVGMAVDANVIIFERIREELHLGKTARSALRLGYANAMSAIVDANITTGIAGLVLWQYGSGPIRGFAITLVVGIIASLFTAIFVTRTIFEAYLNRADKELPIGIRLNAGGS
jgi:protein-export membrane protein SecD